MTEQLSIDFARAAGESAAEACIAKAERVAEFDREGAKKFVLGYLVRHGATPGETLVAQGKLHGYRGHDDRCWGAVFGTLSRRHQIKCLRSDLPREHGHGTSGGKLWAAVL